MTVAVRWLIPAYLALCIFLGGASAGGYLANAVLQLVAIGLCALASFAQPDPPPEHAERVLLAIMAAALLLICVQLAPLPEGVWKALPGRAALARPFQQAGIGFGQHFVSLIPHESLKSAAWLLPPAGVLLAMMRARALFSGRYIAMAVVGAMCLAVLLGAMQIAAGSASALYFYHFTNWGSAVGFFSNANHMASLLLVTIPFQAALLREGLERKGPTRTAAIGAVVASLAVTVTGIVVVGSLAGYGLLLPVALASALILGGTRRTRIATALLLPLAVAAGIAVMLVTHSGQALLDQASEMPVGSRRVIFGTTLTAIKHFWPFGTGLGTFAEVYRAFENPLAVTRTYVNHSHNDYLELVLENGAAGVLLLAAFLVWWVVRAWRIWREGPLSPYAMAAVIASASLLLHSLVDYPLRTAALSSVFAACLALMAGPRPQRRRRERDMIFGES